MTQGKRALVLSGGGGRGAYHVGVLQFLDEHDWWPDVIVGTSIGAVNGAALASGHSAKSLRALWKRLKTDKVQKVNLNPLSHTSILDTTPLRETLVEDGWLRFERINASEPEVDLRITATEIKNGKLHVFGNSPDARKSDMIQTDITLDHILSSCSIPIVYPYTAVQDADYWDGAILANTPLGAAIDAGATEIVVVLMTPYEEQSQQTPEWKGGLMSAVNMMLDWVLLSSFQAEMRIFRNVNKWVLLQEEIDRLRGSDTGETGGKIFVEEPIIISPTALMPLKQIISYTDEGHERLFRLGYEDARRAWQESGRVVEGEGQRRELD